MPADRIRPLVTGMADGKTHFYGTGTLPDNRGIFISVGGNTLDLVMAQDATTAFDQVDSDGYYRSRVFERFAVRKKILRRSYVSSLQLGARDKCFRAKFLPAGSKEIPMEVRGTGLKLWCGTDDAPAPGPVVDPGREVLVVIGVIPADASNQVTVAYSLNNEATQVVAARWIRNDNKSGAHFFRADLGCFQDGDHVSYQPICVRAGRRLQGTALSFRVAKLDEANQPSPSHEPNHTSEPGAGRMEEPSINAAFASPSMSRRELTAVSRQTFDISGIQTSHVQDPRVVPWQSTCSKTERRGSADTRGILFRAT